MMEELEKEFNLLDEPWIVVRTTGNVTKEVSILDLFAHAHEYRGLAGELPTQDIAVMRLLLAVMHAAFVTEDIEDRDDAVELWKALWENRKFPYEVIEQYLEEYRERFWLFHPETPFYQLANIRQAMDSSDKKAKENNSGKEKNVKPVARLIGELFQSEHKSRLAPMRIGEGQSSLSYAEAARWLLHLNGFDDNAAKNPTPKGVGYLGQLGLILVEGKSFFETLMLNFVLVDQRDEIFADGRVAEGAFWETPVCGIIENHIVQPRAQKELLTMQSRRILLKRQNGKVVGYLSTMGDYFGKEEEANLIYETMTGWKRNEKNGFIPRKPDPEKQMWREFSSLLGTGENEDVLMPGVVYWQKILKDEGIVSGTIRLKMIGAHFKGKSATKMIQDYVEDTLDISADLIESFNKRWVLEIVIALGVVDKAVEELGNLAARIVLIDGYSANKVKKETKGNKKQIRDRARKEAREQGYAELNGHFRQWLLSINANEDKLADKIQEWLNIARGILLRIGDDLVKDCGINKIYIREGGMDVFTAHRIFIGNVVKELGGGAENG